MSKLKSTKQEIMLAEFQALRQETITCINARVWGTLTYVAVAGGIGAWYSKVHNPNLGLLLILAALPLLWHTILRERSRIRIGSYIKVVLEPELKALFWEQSLDEWRKQIPSKSSHILKADKWGHIFSLTGIYALGSVLGLIVVFSHAEIYLQKSIALISVVLQVVAHYALFCFYSSSDKYDEIFRIAYKEILRKAKEEEARDKNNCT
jgi:hypothetical protein